MAQVVLDAYNPPTTAADEAGADLIVWPEAAFPRYFKKGSIVLAGHGLSSPMYKGHLLLGVDVYDTRTRKGENAAYLVTPDLRVMYQYTKHHLVPFGEYILFNLDEYLPIKNLVPGTFQPGTEVDPVAVPLRSKPGSNARVGITICFDAIFPEIAREYAAEGVQVLVNMTNDAWYGFSSAPYQFLRMVAMRAIETGRPVARAANTGISAFIDPLGRIQEATGIGLVDTDDRVVDASRRVPSEWKMSEVPLLEGRTIYVVIGDWPAYAAAIFCIAGLVRVFTRRKRAN
jgi:apolipoprotein N-acyltransferase